MKQLRLPALPSIWLLAVAFCALLVVGTGTSIAAESDKGLLIIKRSPTLGSNIVVALTVDGKPVGSVTRGRTLETYLAPGTHALSASPGSGENPWRGTLNVRAGETYTYTASYTVIQLHLTPAAPYR
jgi:hypothetical protein